MNMAGRLRRGRKVETGQKGAKMLAGRLNRAGRRERA